MLKPKRYHQTRLAVRALIVQDARLLLVNAYPGNTSDLWCAPGGGAEPGQSLAENLIREVHEETGLEITPGQVVGISEFTDPATNFHQVEMFFACEIAAGNLTSDWLDPEAVVTKRRFFSRTELETLRVKPDFLRSLPFDVPNGLDPNPLETKAP